MSITKADLNTQVEECHGNWYILKLLTGHTKSTQSGRPWQIVYTKQFDSRSEAVKYENYLKQMKSRRFLQELIESG